MHEDIFSDDNPDASKLSVEFLHRLFSEMGTLCAKRGLHLEIALYGGSALILDFSYRKSTHDIDYCVVKGDPNLIRELAFDACENLGMRNKARALFRDDVTDFVSEHADHILHGDYGTGTKGGLRIFKASPQYILAMKVLSMRSAMETHDVRDTWELCKACEIQSAEEALETVRKFYPSTRIPRRNQLILEDILESQKKGQPYSDVLGC